MSMLALLPTPNAALARTYLPALASSSRLRPVRLLTSSPPRHDLAAELERTLGPRELIERKRKQYEEKYRDQLKRKVEAEGVRDLDALKAKKLAPSIRGVLRARAAAKEYKERVSSEPSAVDGRPAPGAPASAVVAEKERQARSDRAGVKPLSSILNLPLIHLTPHTSSDITRLWTAYHTSHPSLSPSFLSATLSSSTYQSMLSLSRQNPFFVLPLPRPAPNTATDGSVQTDQYEMFYLQWLFHPTSSSSAPPSPDPVPKDLPMTSSILFTPLEEFKQKGEWASPHLVLTHYPELSESHDLVLMRGEISPSSVTAPGSTANPGYLLDQQQAQLLALALQRFYCAAVQPRAETEVAGRERRMRAAALRGFREKPQEWDWEGLVRMAYAGMV